MKLKSPLSQKAARLIARHLDAELRELLPAHVQARMPPTEDFVLFLEVAHRCSHARETRGLTIKGVAAALAAPQYRIKAIEGGNFGTIKAGILERYLRFLGLHRWFQSWSRRNSNIVKRYSLTIPTRSAGRSGDRHAG
jgi:hypothetical protein